MNKRIVYTRPDGGVSVVIPALPKDATPQDEDDVIAKCMVKSVPAGSIAPRICTTAEIPTDRTFRNAWVTEQGKSVEVDLAKAKDVAKDKVRQARTPKFQELDIAYQRADEAGDSDAKTAVATKKQTARDATADTKITNADSVANLKTGMNEVITEVNDL